jgi:hypothetical protein
MSDYSRIRIRRDDTSGWNNSNPVLGLGEPGYEINSRQIKIGNGVDTWSNLEYITIPQDYIDDPTVMLVIGDKASNKLDINLSSSETFNIIGSGDTNVLYDYDQRCVIINSQSNSSILTPTNLINAFGYTPQPSGNYSVVGHSHSISQISGLSDTLNSKQPSGSYATSSHIHNLLIGDGFNTTISYPSNLPLNIVGSGYTNVYYDNFGNTITIDSLGNSGVLSFNNRSGAIDLTFTDITGALLYVPQPVGQYANLYHTHNWTDILGEPKIPYKTVTSGNAPGVSGEICFDNSYLYICVSGNSWRRLAHNPW